MNACREQEIYSVDDLRMFSKASKTVIEILKKNGVLDGLDETNQMTMFQTATPMAEVVKKTPKKEKTATEDTDPAGDGSEQIGMF